MYGWINACIKDLVVKKFGYEKWMLIIQKSNAEVSSWDKHEYYPDSSSFELVAAGCAVLGVEAAELLEVFGTYFISYCTDHGYENLLLSLGSNLGEWLSNVNMLHFHLESTFSEYSPPQFLCYDDKDVDDAIILEYKSTRGAGLEGVVVGIVKEVAARYFNLDVRLELLCTQGANGADVTSWRIRESGPIQPESKPPNTVSPVQMTQEARKELKAAGGKCPFQQHHATNVGTVDKRDSCPALASTLNDPASSSCSKRTQSDSSISLEHDISASFDSMNVRSLQPMPMSNKLSDINDLGVLNKNIVIPPVQSTTNSNIDKVFTPKQNNRLNCRNHQSQFIEQKCDFGLSGQQLNRVFPFHIVFNKELTILQCGHELRLFLDTELVGKKLDELFRVKRPCPLEHWDDFLSKIKFENVFMECLLDQRHDPLQLSGTAISDHDDIITLLCSPNVKNLEEMKNQGLTMSDIPKTDCRYEMILTTEQLQSETNAIARMTALTAQLEIERQARMKLMQEAADNAESALATKRSFVRYVSHEIRTPLTVSMLGLDLIAEEVRALGADESQLSNITECQDSINIAVSILNDLLSYEKLESGILEISASYIPMTGFIRKCLRPFDLQARQKDVTFIIEEETQEDPENPLFINVDMTKMSQVIRNLTSNAIKFTPPGGEVRVIISTCDAFDTKQDDEKRTDETSSAENRVVEIDGNEYPLSSKGGLLLKVIDSGVGISKQNQEKVFKEIIQFSPNELQAGGGSGLGLWIARGLVELHDGQIGMRSDGVGHGSTFFVKLPVYGCTPDIECESIGITSDDSKNVDMKRVDSASLTTQNIDDHTSLGLESTTPQTGGRVVMPKKGLVRTYSKTSSNSSGEEIDMFVLNGLNILVVDDAAMIRKLFKRLLHGHGVHCFLAEDGEDAIAKVQQLQYDDAGPPDTTVPSSKTVITPPPGGGDLKTYDVILMDFIMPVMDGPSATKILRQNGYKGLIVGVTGNMMPSDVEAFEEAGASAVFAKPLELHKLVRYLNLHLDFDCIYVD